MIRATALFYPQGGDLIIGMVTKTYTDITPDEARLAMTEEAGCYRDVGPLKGAEMVVQAAEVFDDIFEAEDETPVFSRKAS